MTQRHEPREPREGYARGLVEIGAEHDDVFVETAEIGNGGIFLQ